MPKNVFLLFKKNESVKFLLLKKLSFATVFHEHEVPIWGAFFAFSLLL
jgi:hypothetical protein